MTRRDAASARDGDAPDSSNEAELQRPARLRKGFIGVPRDWIERIRQGQLTVEQMGILVCIAADANWDTTLVAVRGRTVELHRGDAIVGLRSFADRHHLRGDGRVRGRVPPQSGDPSHGGWTHITESPEIPGRIITLSWTMIAKPHQTSRRRRGPMPLKRKACGEWIAFLLAWDLPMMKEEVIEWAKGEGFSRSLVFEVAKELHLKNDRIDSRPAWRLP